jgi:hypothetical protein
MLCIFSEEFSYDQITGYSLIDEMTKKIYKIYLLGESFSDIFTRR